MASLLALSRAASEEAKTGFHRSIGAHAIGLALGVWASTATGSLSHLAAVSALVGEMIAWAMRHRATRTHGAAEDARRLALLTWAFASPAEPLEAIDLRASFDPWIERRAVKLEDPNYYASVLPPGQERFIESLQESAFWSKRLYRLSATIALVAFGASFLIALIVFVALEPTGARTLLPFLARATVPFITFFISVDLLGYGLGWHQAAQVSERVDRALAHGSTISQPDLLAIHGDYAVATAAAAPIPTLLYRREHDRLNREWRARRDQAHRRRDTNDRGTPAH